MAGGRALMQALQRALSERASSVGRGAIRTGNALNGLANCLMITGGIGGAAGGLLGAHAEQEAGGDPNEGAIGGARAGAMMGPVTIGPGAVGTLAGGPVGPFIGATATLPYLLSVQDGSSEKRRERERRAMQEEAIRRALEMRLREMHGVR